MDQAIANYTKAIKEHIEAQRAEVIAKDQLIKTRHAVKMAYEEMRVMQQELLSDTLKIL